MITRERLAEVEGAMLELVQLYGPECNPHEKLRSGRDIGLVAAAVATLFEHLRTQGDDTTKSLRDRLAMALEREESLRGEINVLIQRIAYESARAGRLEKERDALSEIVHKLANEARLARAPESP